MNLPGISQCYDVTLYKEKLGMKSRDSEVVFSPSSDSKVSGLEPGPWISYSRKKKTSGWIRARLEERLGLVHRAHISISRSSYGIGIWPTVRPRHNQHAPYLENEPRSR